jgi:hypothetical protein
VRGFVVSIGAAVEATIAAAPVIAVSEFTEGAKITSAACAALIGRHQNLLYCVYESTTITATQMTRMLIAPPCSRRTIDLRDEY